MADSAAGARPTPERDPSALTDAAWARVRHHAESVFGCGPGSVHGPAHWRRVETVGVELCRGTVADETVVRLFAILHDSCRLDDGDDLGHGPRAADTLAELADDLAPIGPDRLALLEQAIRHHTGGHVAADPTIGACWDADRLDLGRLGMRPEARYMSTTAGRKLAGGR